MWYTCEWVHVSVYGYGYVYSCFLISSSSLSPLLLFLLFFLLSWSTHFFLSCQTNTRFLHAKLLNVHELKCMLHKRNSKVCTNLKISCCARNISYEFVIYLFDYAPRHTMNLIQINMNWQTNGRKITLYNCFKRGLTWLKWY